MISQRSHPLGQCVQSLQIHNIPKIPPPGSVLTQSSHPWFLKDPTPLVSAYKVFTSMTSQRSQPLGQCVQSLHIHDIWKIPPPCSVRAKSSHPWWSHPLGRAYTIFTCMTSQRSHPLGRGLHSLHIHDISKISPLGQCVQSLQIHNIPKIPPPGSVLTQSSHPWFLKDPTPLVSAYKVFTSMTSQRSQPLGQCVQSLHIHDILKIAPHWSGVDAIFTSMISQRSHVWSVLTQSWHPWYLEDPTPLVGAYTVFTSMISRRSHPLGPGLHSLHIHDFSKIPPPWSVHTKSSHPWHLKDPSRLVSAYKVFTSMISERSHPLGQCAQSLQIHDTPPPWSGLTQPSHPAVKQHPSEYDWMMNTAAVLQEDHFAAELQEDHCSTSRIQPH